MYRKTCREASGRTSCGVPQTLAQSSPLPCAGRTPRTGDLRLEADRRAPSRPAIRLPGSICQMASASSLPRAGQWKPLPEVIISLPDVPRLSTCCGGQGFPAPATARLCPRQRIFLLALDSNPFPCGRQPPSPLYRPHRRGAGSPYPASTDHTSSSPLTASVLTVQ